MAAMFASPQDALTTPARPTCGRVDLINGASRYMPLNPPEMSANEPNSLRAFCRVTSAFPGISRRLALDAVPLAMQKVEGSSPFSRSHKSPAQVGFSTGRYCWNQSVALGATTRRYHAWVCVRHARAGDVRRWWRLASECRI
jgi:hypothetical protein